MGQKYMKKIIISIIMCLATISAMAQERKVDGKGVIYNGNHNFLLSLYGGANYFGDFGEITRKNLLPTGGAEIVYNYYGLRLSLGGSWGNKHSSMAQAGIYWNFTGNPNFKHRAYIGVTGGVMQYSSLVNVELLLNGTSTHLSVDEVSRIKLTLPPNSIAPIVGCRLGVDWRLGGQIYLTTALEGTRNFINKRVNFNTIKGEIPLEDGKMDITFQDSDAPIPVNHWGARLLIGLSIRLK